MKIALAHKRLDRRGGTEAVFYRTAEGLRDLGHEIHLFCGESRISPPKGIFFHKLPYWPLGRTARLLSFALLAPRLISRYHCDLVLSFGRMTSQDILRCGGGSHKLFLQKMARSQGLLKRLWYRVSPYHLSVLALEKTQFRNGSYKKVIAISQRVKSEIIDACSVPPERIVVIYNGVDLERFHPHNREVWSGEIRQKWGIPLNRPVVLFVGNGFRRKGLDRLLNAWMLAGLRDLFLLVVGQDRAMTNYRYWVRAHGLSDRIRFVGMDSAVEKYYASADILAAPSFQEAFGNVCLEALASGLPVMTSSVSGVSEILAGELKEGIIQDPSEPGEIQSCILRLLDGERWPIRSRAARLAAEEYSWEKYFFELERQILDVVGR